MVKDHVAPYLSIVGCVVALSVGNPDEYIRAAAVLSMMDVEYGSGVPVLVMIHTLVGNTRMRSMMIQNFQFDSQDYYWTIEMFGSGWYEILEGLETVVTRSS